MVLSRLLSRTTLALLIFAGSCKPKSGEAVLVVSPGERLNASLGQDIFGFVGKLDGAEFVEGFADATPIPGVLDYSSDRTEISFKLSRGRSVRPQNVLKAELRLESGDSLPIRTFVAIKPLTLDFSTERTVRFFEKILRREPQSPEEILYVLKQFRDAMSGSCLAGKSIGSLSLANRAFNNALSASPSVTELISTFALDEEQRSSLVQSNNLPSAIGGFPYPLADRVNEMSVPENVAGDMSVELMDADRDLFLSEWTLDDKPLAETPKLEIKELREARLDLAETFRATRGLTFKTDFTMSTRGRATRHEIKLSLCDGAKPVVYRYALNITNSNRAPELVSPPPPEPIDVRVGEAYKLRLRFKDIDGDEIVYSPMSSVTANFSVSSTAPDYETAEILQGTFLFQEDTRNRYQAQEWPELGNPWLEGALNRGATMSAGDTAPRELSFFRDAGGQLRARVKMLDRSGTPFSREVPVTFSHYQDPVSGLVNHLQITFGSATEGLSIERPFTASNVQMKCHAFPRGYGTGFSMSLACAAGRFPENMDSDGAWTATYACPESAGSSIPNPRCFPQVGLPISPQGSDSYESEIGLYFRPTRNQVTTGSGVITQPFLVSDQSGGAVPFSVKFRVLDVDAPRVAPFRFVNFQLFQQLSLDDESGPFESRAQTGASTPPFNFYKRSGSVASFSLLKPFRRAEEIDGSSRNVFSEPPGNLRKVYFRGAASFERQEWWQHVRWELENSSGTFPSEVFKDRLFLRFLSKSTTQKYPKLVLSKKFCTQTACSLYPFAANVKTNRGDVPNSTDADVLEYEILSSSMQSFSFVIPVGAGQGSGPLYCNANFLFNRDKHPNPVGEVDDFTEPTHGNFRLHCSPTSLAEAKTSTNYLQFGPGLSSFLSESPHEALPMPGSVSDFLVLPRSGHAWMLRSCAIYKDATNLNGTGCSAEPGLATLLARFTDGAPFSVGAAVMPDPYDPRSDDFATLKLNEFTDVKISPRRSMVEFTQAFAGTQYRWCRYGFRSLLNTLVLTCSKTDPGPNYPQLYETSTVKPAEYATFHLGYVAEVQSAEAGAPWSPARGHLARVLEGVDSALTTPTSANGWVQKLQNPSLVTLPGSKRAILAFKLRYDGTSWKKPNADLMPARPELKSAKVYALGSGGFAGDENPEEVTINPPSVWRSDYSGLGHPTPAGATPSIELAMTGVGRLEDEEFLVAWLTSTPGRYRFVLEFEQPGLPVGQNRVTVSTDTRIEDFTFPPTMSLVDYGVTSMPPSGPTGSLQIKITGPSGAPPIFMKPITLTEHDGAKKSVKLSVAETLSTYSMVERNSKPIDVALKLKGEQSSATAFWLTERIDLGDGTYRTRLVDPEKSPDWYARVPLTTTATKLDDSTIGKPGVFLADASAIIRKDPDHYFLSPGDVGKDPEVGATKSLSGGTTTHKAVVLPRAPLNALVQESKIGALGNRLFKVFRSTAGSNLTKGTTAQLFVAKEDGGLQSTVKLRLDATDYLVDMSKLGGGEVSEDSPGSVVIGGLKLNVKSFSTSAPDSVACRLYLSYEPALVDLNTKVSDAGDTEKGSRTLARYVCQPGTSTAFPSDLNSRTKFDDIGDATKNLGGLVAFEAEAFNPGPFSLTQKQPTDGSEFKASGGAYEGELARVTWGNDQVGQPSLDSSENIADFSGVLVVASGEHLLMQPLSFKTRRDATPASEIVNADPCSSSYTKALRAQTPDTAVKCSLSRLNFDEGASVAALRFQDDLGVANDVGPFIVPAGGQPGISSPTKRRIYAVNGSSSGWNGYNEDVQYRPEITLNTSDENTPYYEFSWKFPTFLREKALDKQTTVRWVPGVDHHRMLFSKSVECALNHCTKSPSINRLALLPPYSYPYKFYGERDIEWKTKAPSSNAWEQTIAFNFVEENLPPCIVPNTGTYDVGAACATADTLISSLTNGYTSVIQPSPDVEGSIRDVILKMTDAIPATPGATAAAKIFEGQPYVFKLRAFDQNNSTSNIRYLGDWKQDLGPLTTLITTNVGGALHHREGEVKYAPLDSHILRTDPYKSVEMKFSIGDVIPDNDSNTSANVTYTLKLDVWDVNSAPVAPPPTSVTYTGTQNFTARTLSFTVRDPDIGDALEIRYLGTSADVFVTCFEENAPSSGNALKSGDLALRIESSGIVTGGTNGGRCNGTSIASNSGGDTPTYTVRLKFWDEPDLAGVPITAYNFEVRDLPWWTLSSADNYVDGGLPKQYSDRHPQPALIQPSKPQVISVTANLNPTPRLENNSGLLTSFVSNEYRKILRVYEEQTLVEPMAVYNPNRQSVVCDFANTSSDRPTRRYRTTQKQDGSWNYANATDLPLLVNLDPKAVAGSNVRSVSPTPSQNSWDTGLASLVPNLSGCVLVWKPGAHWFYPVTADEPRTHKIRVRVRVGSATYYQSFYIGLSGENFVSKDGGQWEAPESGSAFRPSLDSLGWRYFVGSTDPGPSSPQVPTTLDQLPNVVLAEGEKAEFRLTWGSGDFTSLPLGWGVTWYLDGVPILADRTALSYKTDFLSSGLHTISASVRQHSVYGAPLSQGYRIFSTQLYVRNTLPFAEPLENRLVNGKPVDGRSTNGVGFVRINNATDKNKFQTFHVAGLAAKGFAALSMSNSVFKPYMVAFTDSVATSLAAPFPMPTPTATHSLSGNQVTQAELETSSVVGTNPSIQVGIKGCRSTPSTPCNNNAVFKGATPFGWVAGEFKQTGQTFDLARKGTSYRHRGVDFLNFRAGSSDQAVLDYSSGNAFALTIRNVPVTNPDTRFQSIVGGITTEGLEDGNWILAVTKPTSGNARAYLFRNLSSSAPETWTRTELIDVDGPPPGWSPAWTWIAECGECANNNGRKVLFLTRDYRIRWGVLDIDTAQFDEDDASRSKCSSGDGCVKLDLDPLLGPLEGRPAWHLGHLFPKKYSATEWGNNTFVIIESTVGTYRTVNLINGEVTKLAVPGGELTTLHCDNKITSHLDSAGRLLKQRCYVGDGGNEGLNQLR